jgi:lysyl-tRNA synthetase class I
MENSELIISNKNYPLPNNYTQLVQPHEIAGILPKHIDNHNAPFSQTDLEKLVKQASADLEDLDKKRKTEFKDHELEKEYERREELSKMDEVHRKQAEEEHKRVLEEQKHHAKINHPVRKTFL